MTDIRPNLVEEPITAEEWNWVRNLILEVQQDHQRDAFARSLYHWDLAVRQFRKLELKSIVLRVPSEVVLQNHAVCLRALIEIGQTLLAESSRFTAHELALFKIQHSEIADYVEELEQSLREWHHNFSDTELAAAQKAIFGATA